MKRDQKALIICFVHSLHKKLNWNFEEETLNEIFFLSNKALVRGKNVLFPWRKIYCENSFVNVPLLEKISDERFSD